MTSAYSATASVSAKPRMPRPNTWSRAAGLRATLLTSATKMLPDADADAGERDHGDTGTEGLGGGESISQFLSLSGRGGAGGRPPGASEAWGQCR